MGCGIQPKLDDLDVGYGAIKGRNDWDAIFESYVIPPFKRSLRCEVILVSYTSGEIVQIPPKCPYFEHSETRNSSKSLNQQQYAKGPATCAPLTSGAHVYDRQAPEYAHSTEGINL